MKYLARASVTVLVVFYLSMIGLAVASVKSEHAVANESFVAAPVQVETKPQSVEQPEDKTVIDWLGLITSIVGVASVIAAATPTPKDDGILAVVRKVLDLTAFNFGGAKNEKPVKNNRIIR
jgi:hypothetical protein